MRRSSSTASGGTSIATILLIIFIVMKMTGNISWPRPWILSPLWILLLLIVIVLLVVSFPDIVSWFFSGLFLIIEAVASAISGLVIWIISSIANVFSGKSEIEKHPESIDDGRGNDDYSERLKKIVDDRTK